MVADDVLSSARDLDPIRREYAVLLGDLCRAWHAQGRLASTYDTLSFGKRLTEVVRESGVEYYQHCDISLPQSDVKEDTPIHVGPAVFRLLTNPRLLDLVEALIGPEIYSNPVQHVRIKPPEVVIPDGPNDSAVAVTPWHQDQGVTTPDADESRILTVWIPITDATVENGCMLVIPGSHREGLTFHCPGTETQPELHIPDSGLRLEDAAPVPMQAGQVLFMNRRTKHASLGNQSDDIRWSFDLRYNPTGQPTGRSAFPGFVARSRSDPASVLSDPREWADLWHAARASLAERSKPVFNRWVGSPAACA